MPNLFDDFINGMDLNEDSVGKAMDSFYKLMEHEQIYDIMTKQQRNVLGQMIDYMVNAGVSVTDRDQTERLIICAWFVLLSVDDSIVRRTGEDWDIDLPDT